MSNIVLPTERRKATDYNPRLMVLFGKPKSGKSSLMASLENNLIIDLEDAIANGYVRLTQRMQELVNEQRKREGKV